MTKNKYYLVLVFMLCTSFMSCAQQKKTEKTYIEEIELERQETDNEFKGEESILKEEDIANFKGLSYFDIDEKYKVTATFEKIENGRVFEMKTSTSRLPVYQTYAKLTFQLDGKEYQLFAYQNQKIREEDDEYKDYLFIPFTDLTNGESTYGGGRYLDLKIPEGNEVILDFNTSYNPYCCYNDKYSCPIPPMENHLLTEINAGVKAYGKMVKNAKH